jgi:hypothetical protein
MWLWSKLTSLLEVRISVNGGDGNLEKPMAVAVGIYL